MSPINPHRPFTPDPELDSLRPERTGNQINGLNEAEIRNPGVVYWAENPDDIEFGEVQKWFYRQEPDDPNSELMKERRRRQEILRQPLPPIASEQVSLDPHQWTTALDRFVSSGDCERVGVARMRQEWLYENKKTDFSNVVMLGVQHDYEKLKSAPDRVAGTDVTRQYGRAAAAAKKIAGWLREQGWDAEPVTGPMATKLLMIPPALECGFGELGKHGSLINPEFGSAFRLGAVLTDAPFELTPKREFGIDDFCSRCRVCENACPPFAIADEKQMVRGVEKWYVDFDKCIPFFAATSGCAICIAVCPWSLPEVGFNLQSKLARRAERLKNNES